VSMEQLFDGRTVVVTGGSRGLGRAMAAGFAAAGADVVIASRRLESCEDAAAEIAAVTGRRIVPMACHVGRWDEVTAFVERVREEVGDVDVLVNNAGMAPLFSSLTDLSEELFDKTIAVNLKGPFRLSALVGEQMVARGRGVILNVSSVAAIRPKPTDLIYAAAKAGLDTLTAGFARALGPKVRVNTIMAGPFLTDIAKHWDMEVVGARIAGYPLQRAGEPDEIVGAALHLASDAASFTTGAVLRVDGGMGVT